MLQNAYLVAKIGADTAENERNFEEICQKLATTLRAREGLLQLREEVPAALDDLLLDAVEHEGLEVEHLLG